VTASARVAQSSRSRSPPWLPAACGAAGEAMHGDEPLLMSAHPAAVLQLLCDPAVAAVGRLRRDARLPRAASGRASSAAGSPAQAAASSSSVLSHGEERSLRGAERCFAPRLHIGLRCTMHACTGNGQPKRAALASCHRDCS